MSNKIIDEQRRAREEFIRLKKMQSGEMAAPTAAQEIVPTTFKEKLQNFWYHFKWHTIISAFMVVVLAVMITQCATREKYDMMVVFFTYSSIMETETEKIGEYLEPLSKDVDGNGKVSIKVVNCSFNGKNTNRQNAQTVLMKVQSMVGLEPRAILYIVDDDAQKFLEGISEVSLFESEPKFLDDDFYKACEGEEFYQKLPKDLRIMYRRISDTTMENDKTAKAVYEASKELYNKINAKKTEAN